MSAADVSAPEKVCGFCKGQPVGDAASWLDGKPRPPAPCPRCGKVTARHRIQTKGGNVTAGRERIERRLSVVTAAQPEGEVWAIYFDAPADVDLDFLRPDVLPPNPAAGGKQT